MHYNPVGDKVLLRLDPDPAQSEGGIWYASEDTIKFCKRCEMRAEKLADTPCVPTETYDWDKYHDRPNFVGYSRSHEIGVVRAPASRGLARWGKVEKVGAHVKHLHPGTRVLVDRFAGGSLDDVRLVRESEVLVEEVN